MDNKVKCEFCDKLYASEELYATTDSEVICQDCIDDLGYFYCDDCGLYTTDITGIEKDNCDSYYCENCIDNHAFRCDDCHNLKPIGEQYNCSNGDSVCAECYADSYFTCDNCGEVYHTDYYHDDGYCQDCGRNSDSESGEFFRNFYTATFKPVMNKDYIMRKLSAPYSIEIETCNVNEDLESTYCHAKDDGSIEGVEYVLSRLQGDNGLLQLKKVCDDLQDYNIVVDKSCGLHVHIDISDIINCDSTKNRFGHNMLLLYSRFEDYFFNTVSHSRQENEYCTRLNYKLDKIKQLINDRYTAESIYYDNNRFNIDSKPYHKRYHWLNFQNLFTRNMNTVEIRLHQGTTNYTKIKYWTLAHQCLVQYAKDNTTSTVMQSVPLHSIFSKYLNPKIANNVANHFQERQEHFSNN